LERYKPAIKLAIVVPFTRNQFPLVLRNLESIWPKNLPCNPSTSSRHYHKFTDLIFYFNRDILKEPGLLVGQIKNALKRNPDVEKCFAHVKFMNALLTDEEDPYPQGASYMFFKLFAALSPYYRKNHLQTQAENEQHQHQYQPQPSSSSYQAFYYLEPDNLPCRPYWADRLYEESSIPGDFWMRGSILRNRNPLVSEWSFAHHINGNALYNLQELKFARYIDLVRSEFELDLSSTANRFLGSYDIALDLVRRNRSFVSWVDFADMTAYWQYTNTVQNWYRTPVNATELCERDKETYLVHGREVHL
jgi:hypothetical protein